MAIWNPLAKNSKIELNNRLRVLDPPSEIFRVFKDTVRGVFPVWKPHHLYPQSRPKGRESTFARGFYPKPGKCIGLLHDNAIEQKKIAKIVTLGLMADGIIIRASAESNFSTNELVDYLQESMPEAFVEGGGHKQAGSIRFIPIKKNEVIGKIKDYIKSLK